MIKFERWEIDLINAALDFWMDLAGRNEVLTMKKVQEKLLQQQDEIKHIEKEIQSS